MFMKTAISWKLWIPWTMMYHDETYTATFFEQLQTDAIVIDILLNSRKICQVSYLSQILSPWWCFYFEVYEIRPHDYTYEQRYILCCVIQHENLYSHRSKASESHEGVHILWDIIELWGTI